MVYQSVFVVLALLGLTTVFGCAGSTGSESQSLESPDQLLARVKSEVLNGTAILLDVREVEEWQESHLEHARLAPMSQLNDDVQRASALEGLDASKSIYTHCRRGQRAKSCAELLQKEGFTVVPLEVPYEELLEAGFPRGSE